jgi:hypothetical protein
MTAPAGGATVSGTITLSANAADNLGVAGVQFLVDGGNAGAEMTNGPFTRSLDTTALSNGTHTFAAKARDAAGNTATSAAVSVTVSNSVTPGTVTFQQGVGGYTGTKDVFISSQGGGNGYADKTSDMKVFDQSQQTTPYEIRSLIRFDGISIPAGKTVASAKLKLRLELWKTGVTLEGNYLQAAWNPAASTLGWQNRDTSLQWAAAGAKGAGTDYMSGKSIAVAGLSGNGAQTVEINLDPAVVQSWVTTPATNQGIVLYVTNPNTAINISASENGTASYRPQLEITYQ